MNWAKGRATKGRGTSFRGALRYVLHDKGAATSDRVGFVELRNLATEDPHQAWREMMTLCEASDDLKQRAGVKATGRKLTKPVYAFTLNWHEDDRPGAAHMRETADAALQALGMGHLQAVIAEHTDTSHRHVHVIVNLLDPETGKTVSLSNDGHKLDRWADRYEVAQGVIRSPDRRAKFEALEQGRKPPKRPDQAASRDEWEATRGLSSQHAKERHAAIKATFAARVADLKFQQSLAFASRRSEGDRLWNGYKADRKAIRDRYHPFIDAIYRPRGKPTPHPYTVHAVHELQEMDEWKEFGRNQFKHKKAFNSRERHGLGILSNAVRLHFANLQRGGVAALFMLAISLSHRRRVFEELHQNKKQALRQSQAQRRKGRAEALRAACRHELAQRANEFVKQRKATVSRHAGEIAAQKTEWKQLAIERDQAWTEFCREFTEREPEQAEQKSAALRQQFNGAVQGRPKLAQRSGDSDGTADGEGSGKAGDADSVLPSKEENRGWRKRRKAADRQADDSYRPRSRGGRDPGRTRRPQR